MAMTLDTLLKVRGGQNYGLEALGCFLMVGLFCVILCGVNLLDFLWYLLHILGGYRVIRSHN